MSLYDTAKNLVKSAIPSNLTTKESKSSNASTVGTGNSEYDRLVGYYDGPHNYPYYKEICKDPQVKLGLRILKYFLLSKDYILTSNSDSEEDVMITEFIQDMLDNMDTPLREVRKNIYTALKYRFSCQEKVFKINPEGKIVLSGLYPLHIKTLQNTPFVFDEQGNLTHIHQTSQHYGEVDIEISKILLYGFEAEFDEVAGESLLDDLDNITRPKKRVMEWMATYLHKHENPTLYGKASDGLAAKEMRQSFDKIAGGKTGFTIGLEDEVGILESSHRGEAFFNALNLYDNVILRAMFIGNLIMGDASATGSYNQSSTQMDTTLNILNGIHEDIAAGFQVLINQIVEWNFGVNANAPNIKFESFIGKDYLALLSALQPYAQNMLVDTTSPWFEELIATTVQEQSGIKVDRDTVTEDDDEADVDYAMNTPIPGDDEANNLINQIL